MSLSTSKLHLIPSSSELQRICKAISTLEAIICPEWEYRYYSYQKAWSDREEFCEMRDGEGDHLLILFNEGGTCINGFAHESGMNGWQETMVDNKEEFVQKIAKGVVDDLPSIFDEFVFGEPARSIGTTFCIWCLPNDSEWKTGDIEFPSDDYKDGSEDLLQLLDGNPATFKEWAEDYYEDNFQEHDLKLELVEQIYKGTPLTEQMVLDINPELDDWGQLVADLDEIGYPHTLEF